MQASGGWPSCPRRQVALARPHGAAAAARLASSRACTGEQRRRVQGARHRRAPRSPSARCCRTSRGTLASRTAPSPSPTKTAASGRSSRWCTRAPRARHDGGVARREAVRHRGERDRDGVWVRGPQRVGGAEEGAPPPPAPRRAAPPPPQGSRPPRPARRRATACTPRARRPRTASCGSRCARTRSARARRRRRPGKALKSELWKCVAGPSPIQRSRAPCRRAAAHRRAAAAAQVLFVALFFTCINMRRTVANSTSSSRRCRRVIEELWRREQESVYGHRHLRGVLGVGARAVHRGVAPRRAVRRLGDHGGGAARDVLQQGGRRPVAAPAADTKGRGLCQRPRKHQRKKHADDGDDGRHRENPHLHRLLLLPSSSSAIPTSPEGPRTAPRTRWRRRTRRDRDGRAGAAGGLDEAPELVGAFRWRDAKATGPRARPRPASTTARASCST